MRMLLCITRKRFQNHFSENNTRSLPFSGRSDGGDTGPGAFYSYRHGDSKEGKRVIVDSVADNILTDDPDGAPMSIRFTTKRRSSSKTQSHMSFLRSSDGAEKEIGIWQAFIDLRLN